MKNNVKVLLLLFLFACSLSQVNSWECVNGNCYYFSNHTATWLDARKYCLDRGADLAVPFSKANNDYLYSEMKKKGIKSAFIGLFKTASDLGSNFYTTNGRLQVFINWASGEPNNQKSKEHCVEIYGNNEGKHNDLPCTCQRYFICQIAGSCKARR
ncbi:collectin-10-like [Xenia sp. Carnegie-2017]|uniref:collectin-10-like n=1 Tax=Xenia sp. Carnegie-2017 TaxID=2897299 RepID=UPI001F04A3CE|nr:collectin-10-like [Xenia sp. Carnegie-2017]